MQVVFYITCKRIVCDILIVFPQTNVKVETKDGKDTTLTFRKILLNKCQKEFEREKTDEINIHEKMEELLKQGLSVRSNGGHDGVI
jgi:hypothetical protein